MGEHVQGQPGADRAVGRPGPAARMVSTEAVRPRPPVLIEPVAPPAEPETPPNGHNGGKPATAPWPSFTRPRWPWPRGKDAPDVAVDAPAADVEHGVEESSSPAPAEPDLRDRSPDAEPEPEVEDEVDEVRLTEEDDVEPVESPVEQEEPKRTRRRAPAVATRQPRETFEGPRAARVFVTHVEPWSVMKQAFLLALALAVVLVIAAASIWYALDAAGVLEAITRTAADVGGQSGESVSNYLSFGRVMAAAMVVAGVETILVTALATLFAFLYNLAVGIGGGLEVTIAEDD